MERFQPYQCVRHYDERHIQIQRDYTVLCNGSQPKAAILWMLEEKIGFWVALTLDDFGPIAALWELDEPGLEQALQELHAQDYILCRLGSEGRFEYRLHTSVIQQALSTMDYSYINELETIEE